MSDFESVTIQLPYPPSANRYWRIFRNRAVLSAEATEYKRVAKGTAICCGVNAPSSDDLLSVVVVLHPKQKRDGTASKTVIDLDNCLKVALDSLQGTVYENDRQIVEIHAAYGEPKDGGGLTVSISKK